MLEVKLAKEIRRAKTREIVRKDTLCYDYYNIGILFVLRELVLIGRKIIVDYSVANNESRVFGAVFLVASFQNYSELNRGKPFLTDQIIILDGIEIGLTRW